MLCKKGILRNFAKFTGKHLCQSLFLNKVAGLRLATLFKKRLWHRCFPVNFAKFLRTPFFTSDGYICVFSALTKIYDEEFLLEELTAKASVLNTPMNAIKYREDSQPVSFTEPALLDIKKIINNLNFKMIKNYNDILAKILKLCSSLFPVLESMQNRSSAASSFPDDLNLADIFRFSRKVILWKLRITDL